MIERPRIINVERKPRKCPVCGGEIVDIIYGTGDMTEPEFLLEYRREGIMGGDNIPRRPPIWACACGCKRFRKVNPDGTDAAVKVKMLKNIRKRPLTIIEFTTAGVEEAVIAHLFDDIHHYRIDITTEYGERETLRVSALNERDARDEAPEKRNGEDGLPLAPYAVYNIGGGQPENLLDFVQTLQEELLRAGVLPQDYDFEAHNGFTPKITLREGLRKFAEWYKSYYCS